MKRLAANEPGKRKCLGTNAASIKGASVQRQAFALIELVVAIAI